jgi:hypothetical protein
LLRSRPAQVVSYTLDEDIHAAMLRTFQSATMLCGVMGLVQPRFGCGRAAGGAASPVARRDAFIMTLCRFAQPSWEEVNASGAYAFTEQNFQVGDRSTTGPICGRAGAADAAARRPSGLSSTWRSA